MKAEQLKKILIGKSKTLSLRINPQLLNLLDETLQKDMEFNSRNELIEVLILRYLESKHKI
jgi:metal-responsive CopG/Arc/MetJ family transcriptional regulator